MTALEVQTSCNLICRDPIHDLRDDGRFDRVKNIS